jgi:2-aminoadipate transaminase
VLSDALATELGDAFTFAPPQGGMFLWGQLQRPEIDTAALLPTAIDHGVAYVPGSAFSVEAPHATSLRLSFATVAPDQLVLGAGRLADVLLTRKSRASAATGSAPISR